MFPAQQSWKRTREGTTFGKASVHSTIKRNIPEQSISQRPFPKVLCRPRARPLAVEIRTSATPPLYKASSEKRRHANLRRDEIANALEASQQVSKPGNGSSCKCSVQTSQSQANQQECTLSSKQVSLQMCKKAKAAGNKQTSQHSRKRRNAKCPMLPKQMRMSNLNSVAAGFPDDAFMASGIQQKQRLPPLQRSVPGAFAANCVRAVQSGDNPITFNPSPSKQPNQVFARKQNICSSQCADLRKQPTVLTE